MFQGEDARLLPPPPPPPLWSLLAPQLPPEVGNDGGGALALLVLVLALLAVALLEPPTPPLPWSFCCAREWWLRMTSSTISASRRIFISANPLERNCSAWRFVFVPSVFSVPGNTS